MGLNDLFDQAETVFIGTVSDAETPPDGASGPYSVFRQVSYMVNGVLKGTVSGNSIDVFHHVVSDGRDRQPVDTLDTSVPFRRGAKLLVFAVEGPDPEDDNRTQLEEIDSDDGVFELTPALQNALVSALATTGSAPRGAVDLRPWLILAILLALAGWLFALL